MAPVKRLAQFLVKLELILVCFFLKFMRLVEFEALDLLHLAFRRFFVRPFDLGNGLLQEAFERSEKVVIVSLD